MTATLSYSIIRYVGDPVRRECVNVGVVVWSQEGVIVRTDPGFATRVVSVWPEFDPRMFRAVIRDLKHAVGDVHQLSLGERRSAAIDSVHETVINLAALMANSFTLTDPLPYLAGSLKVGAERLLARFVTRRRTSVPRRERYMSRPELRTTISETLGYWASINQPDAVLTENSELQGAIAPHRVDLIASTGDSPSMLFFAVPVAGSNSALIRDALPTVVGDLRVQHPTVKFFAVLGEGTRPNLKGYPDGARLARAVLKQTPDLTVFDLSELKSNFGSRGFSVPSPLIAIR